MVIESRLNQSQLKDYRHWKQDVRVSASHVALMAKLLLKDRSPRRLFDNDFFPIFIGGVAGSGTTLMGALLNQNFENRLNFIGSERTKETSRLLWREKGSSFDSLDDYVADLKSPTKNSTLRIRAAVLGLYRRSSSYPYSSPIVIDKGANSRLIRIGILRKAFPKSGNILIYRDPVEVIEGLRRKWPKLYSSQSIEELSDFWIFLHANFLKECEFEKDLVVISYKNLVDHSSDILESLSEKYGLSSRGEIKAYKDKSNRPGKGLRNVEEGKIKIMKNAFDSVSKTISDEEAGIIKERTRDMLVRLNGLTSYAVPGD
jgi:hypothetical protein